MYSSSVSPFQAYTGTPVLAIAAAAWSWVENILQLDHWTYTVSHRLSRNTCITFILNKFNRMHIILYATAAATTTILRPLCMTTALANTFSGMPHEGVLPLSICHHSNRLLAFLQADWIPMFPTTHQHQSSSAKRYTGIHKVFSDDWAVGTMP